MDTCGDDGHARLKAGDTAWTIDGGTQTGVCSIAASPDEAYVLFMVVGKVIYESDDAGQSWRGFASPSYGGRVPIVRTNRRSNHGFDLWFGDVSLFRAECKTPNPPQVSGAPRCPATTTWAGPFTRDAGGHDDIGDLIFSPDDSVDACPVMFSSDGGIYLNTISQKPLCQSPKWTQPDVTPHALWVYAMSASPHGLYFGDQDTGVFLTNDFRPDPPKWVSEDCCDSFDADARDATLAVYTDCCYDGGRFNRLFIWDSTKLASTELPDDSYPPGDLPTWKFVNALASLGNHKYIIVTSQGVFATQDITAKPVQWSNVGDPPASLCGVQVTYEPTTSNPQIFILSGKCDSRTPIHVFGTQSLASGAQWNEVTVQGGSFGLFAVDPANPKRIIASVLSDHADPSMVLSTNGGQSWSKLGPLDTLMTASGLFRYKNTRGPTEFTNFDGYPQPTVVAFDPADNQIVPGRKRRYGIVPVTRRRHQLGVACLAVKTAATTICVLSSRGCQHTEPLCRQPRAWHLEAAAFEAVMLETV